MEKRRVRKMKNKRVIRIFSALLAVMLCMTVFSTVAFAGGAEPNESFTFYYCIQPLSMLY